MKLSKAAKVWIWIITTFIFFFLLSKNIKAQELFNSHLFVKTTQDCELRFFSLSAKDSDLLMIVDQIHSIELNKCVSDKESLPNSLIFSCEDKCGNFQQFKMNATSDGLLIYVNSKQGNDYTISTNDICH